MTVGWCGEGAPAHGVLATGTQLAVVQPWGRSGFGGSGVKRIGIGSATAGRTLGFGDACRVTWASTWRRNSSPRIRHPWIDDQLILISMISTSRLKPR